MRLAEDYGSLPEIARVRLVLGVLAYGLAEWDKAEAHGEHARQLYERLGDRKEAVSHRGHAFRALRRYLENVVT